MSNNEQRLYSCLGLVFAAVACMAALIVVPEIRCLIGIENCGPTPIAQATETALVALTDTPAPGAPTTAPGNTMPPTDTPVPGVTPAAPDVPTQPAPSAIPINLGANRCQGQALEGWCWINDNSNGLLSILYTPDGQQLYITVLDAKVQLTVNGAPIELKKTGRGKTMQAIIPAAAPWDVQLLRDQASEHYTVTYQP